MNKLSLAAFLFFAPCLNSYALNRDSLIYRKSFEINFQSNLTISHSTIDGSPALNEIDVYTKIYSLFYSYKITKILFIRTGISTGTIGILSEPRTVSISTGRSTSVKAQASKYSPATFINIPLQMGFQKEIKAIKISPFLLFGFEGISKEVWFIKKYDGFGSGPTYKKFQEFQESRFYNFTPKEKYDLSRVGYEYQSVFNFYSLTTGIYFNYKSLKCGVYYQYRGSKKMEYKYVYSDKLYNRNWFANCIGFSLGFNLKTHTKHRNGL
jgi:hypothetical protein